MNQLNQYLCKICRKAFQNLTYCVTHLRLHQNVNARLPCAFENCSRNFFKFSSLKAHISRDHTKILIQNHSQSLTLTCNVQTCQQNFSDKSLLISHLQRHIQRKEKITCPYENCKVNFDNRSSFSSHVSRKHGYKRMSGDTFVVQNEQLNISVDRSIDTLAETSVLSDSETTTTTSQMYSLVSLLCLRLMSKFHLPASIIDIILNEMSNIHRFTLENILSCINMELIKADYITDANRKTILEKLKEQELFSEVFSEKSLINSDYLRRKYFKENFKYVEPISVSLGRNKNNKNATFHYVPIIDSLIAYMSNPSVKMQLKNVQPCSKDNVLSDYTDGRVFKDNVYFKDDNKLKLFLYTDSFETVNPLGSGKKKHKILAVYYTLGNIFKWFRSKVDPLQLVLLCRQVHFDYFGQELIFRPLITDLKKLENGILLNSGEFIEGSVFVVIGDNLGSHCIGGFTENFNSSFYQCRYCTVHKSEMFTDNFVFSNFEIRTKANYNAAADLVEQNNLSNHMGIKFNSLFNELQYFHVCQPGLPPCIGHDIFEGVIAYDMLLFVKQFMTELSLSQDLVNGKINAFHFGVEDSRDKPCEVNIKSNKLNGHAVQNWNFLRLFPLIFIEYFHDNDLAILNLIILLHKIVELICAPNITFSQIYYMQDLIEEYLQERKIMFPDISLRPKHHFMLHYPALTIKFGPLIRMWTMRFESKHSYFRQCVHHSQNVINVTKSLSERHQLLQAYIATGPVFEDLILESAMGFHLSFFSDEIQSAVAAELGNLHLTALHSEKITFRGVKYKKDMFVVISRDENQLVFGKIIFLLIVNNIIYFVVQCLESCHCPKTNLFFIKKDQELKVQCLSYFNILDYYPLHGYIHHNDIIIPLKHGVSDNFD